MHGHGGTTSHVLHHLLWHQKDIGLTDEQVTKLKNLALAQDRAQVRTHADIRVAERELRALAWDEKMDLSIIEAKVKEREALEVNLRFVGFKGKRDLLAVLTPEQRDKLKAIREEMRESHRAQMFSSQGREKTDRERWPKERTRRQRARLVIQEEICSPAKPRKVEIMR